METITITKGPFKGETFDASRTAMATDENGNSYLQLRFADATQAFLEKFPPTDGWQLVITSTLATLDMPAYRRNDGVQYPAMLYQASLLSPNNVTIATASTLWVIDGPTAFERGETNARMRLYQALGLQIHFNGTPPAAPTKDSSTPVKVVPTSEPPRGPRQAKPAPAVAAPEPAQADAAEADAASPTDPVSEDSAPAEASTADDVPAADTATPEPTPVAAAVEAPTSPDAPSKSLLKSIETQCRMRGVAMPVLTTKADAMAFLRSLGS